MGPTACNKSLLAMTLKDILPIELVSVDSALIYRGMDIGTAKPSNMELLKYPHFLVNIRDPLQTYSVGEFYKDILKIIDYIHSINKVPLLVGGTMFYFKILLTGGLSNLPSSNDNIRKYLLTLLQKKSKFFLFNQLKSIDPISAERIHFNDVQRVLRALEVFFISGKTLTELCRLKNFVSPYNIVQFSLMPESKEWLFNKITIRFKKMLSCGFEYEVKKLFNRGDLHKNLPSIRCVGYRQMWDYFMHNLTYDDMICESLKATKRLVKSQLTWLNNWKKLNVLSSSDTLKNLITKIISVINANIFV
ncbi:tRNA (adenosine(37)-N6)-dimethylallyltransferase MiaA [Buchnera aphidicola]